MQNKVVLLDLENNMPSAKMLRDIVEHYPTLYLFNCEGGFRYSLEDLTEFSSWISSGQVVILETPEASQREYEYAVVVGQLMALLDSETHIEVISAMPNSEMLIELLCGSDLSCSLIQTQSDVEIQTHKMSLPSLATIQEKPYLQLVKKYCDALGKMSGKPNTIEKLRNSISNVLQVVPEKAQHLVGMLINLKIVKSFDEQVSFRKKVLKQWVMLKIDQHELSTEPNADMADVKVLPKMKLEKIDQILESLKQNVGQDLTEVAHQDATQNVQKALFKNFEKIDPVQMEVIRKLNELKDNKPKDIYQLRDVLEQLFPKTDIRLLLKELIEKGYIYWNGHEVVYSHEMYLN